MDAKLKGEKAALAKHLLDELALDADHYPTIWSELDRMTDEASIQ